MSVAKTIRAADVHGVWIGIEGTDLILDSEVEPPADVVNAIRRHEAEIIELLAPPGDGWSAEHWRAFYCERIGIAEMRGGLSRTEVEATALECCVVEWLNLHLDQFDPSRCAWCDKPDRERHIVVPFGTENHGHTWLHPECWDAWHQTQRVKARLALTQCGVGEPNP